MSEKRLRELMAGKKASPPAYSLWRHFIPEENSGPGLAKKMLAFQKEYGHDFIKANPRSTYFIEDWGPGYEPDARGKFTRQEARVKQVEDLVSLPRLDPKTGVLGEHLAALRDISGSSPVPVIMTLFNPLSYAGRLAGEQEDVIAFGKESPQELEKGLAHLAAGIAEYVDACLDAGAAGIFYATTEWGSRDFVADDFYARFGRPFDLKAIESLDQRAWFNVLHVCGDNNRLLEMMDYPLQALNWDAAGKGNPSLDRVHAKTGKLLVGGIAHGLLGPNGNWEALRAGVDKALAACAGGERLVLGPGCCIPENSDAEMLEKLSDYLKNK